MPMGIKPHASAAITIAACASSCSGCQQQQRHVYHRVFMSGFFCFVFSSARRFVGVTRVLGIQTKKLISYDCALVPACPDQAAKTQRRQHETIMKQFHGKRTVLEMIYQLHGDAMMPPIPYSNCAFPPLLNTIHNIRSPNDHEDQAAENTA